MSKMNEQLQEKFTSEVNTPFVKIFQRAYESNAECYDPGLGHDEMVYGLMIHKSAKHFIVKLADTKKWVEIIQQHPRFLFRVEGFLMSSYRVGESLDGDIVNSFPKNRTGAWMLAEANKRQMSFEFMNDGNVETDDSNCRSLILAHRGTVDGGLESLFLGVPASFDDRNRITKWSTVFSIYGNEGTASAPVDERIPGGQPPQHPVEKTAPPRLTLKDQKKPQENK